MVCPKCGNNGTIVKIKFKKTSREAYLCEACEALWFTKDDISPNTGHSLETYVQAEGSEYTIEELQEIDQDHRPVKYADYK